MVKYQESKQDKFLRLAAKREQRAHEELRLISQLSSKNYEYSYDQSEEIVKRLVHSVAKIATAFGVGITSRVGHNNYCTNRHLEGASAHPDTTTVANHPYKNPVFSCRASSANGPLTDDDLIEMAGKIAKIAWVRPSDADDPAKNQETPGVGEEHAEDKAVNNTRRSA